MILYPTLFKRQQTKISQSTQLKVNFGYLLLFGIVIYFRNMNTRSKQEELLATFSKMLNEKLNPVIERLEKIEHSLSYTLDELKKFQT